MDKFLGMFAAMCVVSSLEALTIDKWNERIPKDGLKWSRTEEGGIRLTLSARGPRKGGDGYLWAEVPLIERGILDFDYRAKPPLRNREQSAFITLYGIRTFFHDGCGDWRVVFPEPNANRETGFHDEPVRHHRIAKVKADEWHHCRIKFDAPNDRAEFFVDDMSDPAFIAGSMSVWSEAEFLGGELRIGGMGGSKNCEAEFRNVILSEAEKDGKSPARTETLVFNGMVHEFYGVEDVLKHDNPRVYLLDFTRDCYWSKNCYKYSRLPGMETVSRARRIVLVDAPASFDHVLPDFLLDDFAKAVEDGAELIVLDGPFALDRGEYAGTPIARILPDGALHGTAFPLPVAEPEILERKVGKGQVKVFRGFRLGSEPCDCRRRFLPWAERLFANAPASTAAQSCGAHAADWKSDPAKYWNFAELSSAPAYRELKDSVSEWPGLKSLLVSGKGPKGSSSEFFCYYGRPEGEAPEGGFPGIVLVHGGGGTAYPHYTTEWVKLGFAVIALDWYNQRPAQGLTNVPPSEVSVPRIPLEGGRRQDHVANVANIVLSHSLLLSFPEVNRDRTAFVGLSWGSWYGTCVAAVDGRLKGCVEIYCGDWNPARSKVNAIVNGRFLPYTKVPMWWAVSTNDRNVTPYTSQAGFDACAKFAGAAIVNGLPHSHIGFQFPSVKRMAKYFTGMDKPLPRLVGGKIEGGVATAEIADFGAGIASARLGYTTSFETPTWKREWKYVPAKVEGRRVSAALPSGTVQCYLSVYEAGKSPFDDLCGSTGFLDAKREPMAP